MELKIINPASGLLSLLAILLILTIPACYYDVEEELYPVEPIGDVTYANDIEPIIDTYCAIGGCHLAGGLGVGVFDSYEKVKLKVDNGSFRKRVVDRKDMPPDGLPERELQKIQKWLNEGAPNN